MKRTLAKTVAVVAIATSIVAPAAVATAAAGSPPAGQDHLLAEFGFDALNDGATGTVTDDLGLATATIMGSAATATSRDGSRAAALGSGFWMNVQKNDGSPLLAGQNSVTISYDVATRAATNATGWSVFAARDANPQSYPNEHYLGVIDTTSQVAVERYNNSGSRDTAGNASGAGTGTDWKHVDVVVDPTSTKLYIDGALAGQGTPSAGRDLTDILGSGGGVFQLGRGNWGDGEYFNGSIDDVRVYSAALTADEVGQNYEAEQAAGSEADQAAADATALSIPSADGIRTSISLPDVGAVNGSTITWASSPVGVVSTEASPAGAAGLVTRPQADTAVTLTATITKGDATVTRDFPVTVKAAVAQEPTTDYVFAHFTGTEGAPTDEQIYFATSHDGARWTDLRAAGDPALTSDVGEKGVRDPYLVRSPEGDTFYLIATDLSVHNRGGWGGTTTSGSTSLVIWESHDLADWGTPRLVDVASAIPGAGMAWAPEAYWDAANGQYMVYWATAAAPDNTNGDPVNMYYATTRDFVTFSTPVKWIDRTNSIIDTTMMKGDDGWFYRASGDGQITIEKTKDPYAVSTATTAADETGSGEDSWIYVGTLASIFNNDGYTGGSLEGPEFVKYNDDDITTVNGVRMPYGLMADQYAAGRGYLPFLTADPGSTARSDWSTADKVNFSSLKKRHGTILPVTANEYAAITSAFGNVAAPVQPDAAGSSPFAAYDFNDGTAKDTTENGHDMILEGGAMVQPAADHGGDPALALGGQGQYGQLPTGLLDGRDQLTLEFSAKSNAADGNFFSFGISRDQGHYLFLRLRGDEAYAAITTGSYGSENGLTAQIDTSVWHDYTLTVTPKRIALFVDGVLAAENNDVVVSVSDLGKQLQTTFGKSAYGGDGTFPGVVDSVRLFGYAKSDAEVGGGDPGQQSSDANLATLSIAGAPVTDLEAAASAAGTSLEVVDPSAVSVADVVYTLSDPKATAVVSASAGTVTVTVTAEDGTVKTFIVALKQASTGGTDPGTGQPGTGQPGTGQPGTGQPGTGGSGTGQPGTGPNGGTPTDGGSSAGTAGDSRLASTGAPSPFLPLVLALGALVAGSMIARRKSATTRDR